MLEASVYFIYQLFSLPFFLDRWEVSSVPSPLGLSADYCMA